MKRIERQFAEVTNQSNGFPGCMSCLDCASWDWGSCPKAFQGIMKGKDKVPTLRMEVIWQPLDLHIWHLYFGLPGVMNDLNIPSVSSHFADVLSGKFPPWKVDYKIGTESFDWMYCLADGIYPEYKVFVRSLSSPTCRKQKGFTLLQESVRKCVERVFGLLFKQFSILFQPGRLYFSEDLNVIVRDCCILHNMVVEKRKGAYVGNGIWGFRSNQSETPNENGNLTLVPLDNQSNACLGSHVRCMAASEDMYSHEKHLRPVNALKEHIWELHGEQNQ